MRSKGLILGVGLIAAVASFGFNDDFKRERGGPKDAAKNALEGKEPPALVATEFLNSNGKKISWKDLKGKVVVVDFWTQWCGPCKASVPHVKELIEKYKDKGLVVVGVHSDPDTAKMKAVVSELGMNWIIAQDGEKKTFTAMAGDSFPDYYLIDRKGVLRFADLANAEVDRAVEMLIAEKP